MRYGIAIALSAFLLFQVQPLIAAFILPWFGGTPAVWTTCLLFFQTALVGGYAYAHWIGQMSPRVQGVAHIALLGLTLLVLPITPADTWKPAGDEIPILRILLLLSATVGAPYLLLSTTGPLLQRWFSIDSPTTSPYRLYALSNAASLLGLLAYPFIMQPLFETGTQAAIWSVGYAAFALATGWCAFKVMRVEIAVDTTVKLGVPPPPWRQHVRWLLFSATGSAVLLSTTNTLTQDVAAVPFLWVLPLGLYLITFIIAFEKPQWYRRRIFAPAMFLFAVPLTLPFEWIMGNTRSFLITGTALVVLVFVCCMVCHGELARIKPAPEHLTRFYLVIAIGGAVGGALVALVSPIVFPHFFEFPIAIVAAIVLFLHAVWTDPAHPLFGGQKVWAWGLITLAVWFVGLGIGGSAIVNVLDAIDIDRNFYGVIRVSDSVAIEGERYRTMHHGNVLHGLQFLEEDYAELPTTYYSQESGGGIAFSAMQALHPQPMEVGLIGLGVGTLAYYGRSGDTFRFYEINPAVIRLADEHFDFLDHSEADIEMVLGDARLALERERPALDLLIVDAFSGDSIPVHLITQEAFELYDDVVNDGGMIALHLSNHYLHLEPVALGAARAIDHQAILVDHRTDEDNALAQASTWMLMSKNEELIDKLEEYGAVLPDREILWTDRYSSILRILN